VRKQSFASYSVRQSRTRYHFEFNLLKELDQALFVLSYSKTLGGATGKKYELGYAGKREREFERGKDRHRPNGCGDLEWGACSWKIDSFMVVIRRPFW
jgi:hypothetical protein